MNIQQKKREKSFKYYCCYCDFGTFSEKTLKTHNNTNKRKNFISILSKNN